jgi:hypothetical protein
MAIPVALGGSMNGLEGFPVKGCDDWDGIPGGCDAVIIVVVVVELCGFDIDWCNGPWFPLYVVGCRC